MSAIFGLMHLAGAPLEGFELAAMSRALAPHGPDREGSWMVSHVALGHRLLRITPEDEFEQQPVSSHDNHTVLVCDARIDNRPELALDLGIRSLGRTPDSEFVRRAYQRWGVGAARRLIGAFALAIWEPREQRLVLARSPRAERPLFYVTAAGRFAFASAPRALFALPGVPRAIDEQFLADYLAHERPEPGTSFYQGIRRVPPGHTLVVSPAGTVIHRSSDDDAGRELRFSRDDDYVEAFEELFTRVVRDHLRSSRPVGVMLSGGLDSSSVAATAAPMLEAARAPLLGFTEVPRAGFDGPVPPGRYADERPFVQALADRYPNLTPYFIDTAGRSSLDDLDATFDWLERPHHRPTNRVWHEAILAAAQRLGVGVMLHATQGNLTISWDGQGLFAHLCRTGRWRQAWRETQTLAASPRGRLRRLATQGVLPNLPTWLYLAIGRARFPGDPAGWSYQPWRAVSAIHPDFARVHQVDERARAKRPDIRLRLYPDTRPTRLGVMARLADVVDGIDGGYQARFGIESRDPTGDPRLARFCMSLPETQYLRNGRSRWLIRRAMQSHLPVEILENRRRGVPAADWLERMVFRRDHIQNELALLGRIPMARCAIDLARLARLAGTLERADAARPQDLSDYRGALETGLTVGRFIRWFERERGLA